MEFGLGFCRDGIESTKKKHSRRFSSEGHSICTSPFSSFLNRGMPRYEMSEFSHDFFHSFRAQPLFFVSSHPVSTLRSSGHF